MPRRTARVTSEQLLAGAQAGYYCLDMAAPINGATFDAAVESAECAVAATETVLSGDRAAYALCLPPGHHAGRIIAEDFVI